MAGARDEQRQHLPGGPQSQGEDCPEGSGENRSASSGRRTGSDLGFYTISLATAACKQMIELRMQSDHQNSGGQLKVATKDAAQASDMGDWETGGATYQAGALEPTKGSLKRGGQEEVLVSGCLRLAGHHLLNTVPLPQVVDGIEVYGTKVHCKVTSRFAHNVVTTRAVNHADTAKEVSFNVELPKTAFITNFTLWVSSRLLALGWEGSLAQHESPSSSLSLQDH